MKGYLQPLSEVFVYGSPERLQSGCFRRRALPASPPQKPGKRQQERSHVDKPKH